MLIIGKNRDYYDGVAGTTGIDKTIVYKRETVEVDDIPIFFESKRGYYPNENKKYLNHLQRFQPKMENRKKFDGTSFFIIGFCGKLYIGLKQYTVPKTGLNPNIITEITYDVEYMRDMFEKKNHYGFFDNTLNFIKTFNPIELFRKFNSPVFVYDYDYHRVAINPHYYNSGGNSMFLINPVLKNYDFYKVFDAYQTFQEIQMFIGGVLGNTEKEIVEIADKYKIQQHGFDKWSFRKEPKNKR